MRARGIDVPVVPGLMPIHNFAQVAKFAGSCGATVPGGIARRFEGLEHDAETTHLMAATVAAEQALGLAEQGVHDFHFYTLNRAKLVYAICHLLGVPAETRRCAGPPRGRGRVSAPDKSMKDLSMTREQRIAALKAAAKERILILDGAMGTMIQRHKLDEADYRGDAFQGLAARCEGQ